MPTSASCGGFRWTAPAPRRITRGFRDTRPRFSADGRLLGFLRADAGGPPQLAIVSADGGEPMVVTDAPLGVRDFVLSADGTRVAFIAAVPEPGRYGTIDGRAGDAGGSAADHGLPVPAQRHRLHRRPAHARVRGRPARSGQRAAGAPGRDGAAKAGEAFHGRSRGAAAQRRRLRPPLPGVGRRRRAGRRRPARGLGRRPARGPLPVRPRRLGAGAPHRLLQRATAPTPPRSSSATGSSSSATSAASTAGPSSARAPGCTSSPGPAATSGG